ncbi:MAG: hypothetical protein V3V01_16905, partial [Acidimicrobiales bacterium]
LRWWEARHPKFKAVVTITGENPDPNKPTGRIPTILADLFPSLDHTSLFVAGSPQFVEDCVAAARSLGAEEELIHTEGFVDQNLGEFTPS